MPLKRTKTFSWKRRKKYWLAFLMHFVQGGKLGKMVFLTLNIETAVAGGGRRQLGLPMLLKDKSGIIYSLSQK